MSEPKKHYIDNDFGRTWVTSRFEARKGVHIPLSYIDINDGNLHDAVVFSQIMYWHEPNTETGKPRLKRWRDGHLWLMKNHGDWEAECRINRATVRKCLERIKDRQLIHYELHGERGLVSPSIRVNWETFEVKMKQWIADHAGDMDEDTPDTTGQGVCPEISDPLIPEVKSNTKSTSKSTQRVKTVSASAETPPPTADAPNNPHTVGNPDADALAWAEVEQEYLDSLPKPVYVGEIKSNRKAQLADYGNRMAEHIEALPPVGIDDFGKADIAEGYAVTPPPSRTEPLQDLKTALFEVYGWDNEGVLHNYGRMLRGIKGRKGSEYDTYKFSVPMTADELRAFVVWWKRQHPDLTLPSSPEGMAKHISAYRAAQHAKPAAPVVNLPSQDELHARMMSYNADEVL